MDDEKGALWVAGESLDPRHTVEDYRTQPQLYNLDATPYESLMIGAFSAWQGPASGSCKKQNLQKPNDIPLGFSGDGFHWYHPDRRRFIA